MKLRPSAYVWGRRLCTRLSSVRFEIKISRILVPNVIYVQCMIAIVLDTITNYFALKSSSVGVWLH
jgi:hypothetical protein